MILHLLSLIRWEWFKLRRRWFPWVLLIIFILFTQMLVWIGFSIDRAEGPSGQAMLEYSFISSEGTRVSSRVDCARIFPEGALTGDIEEEELRAVISEYVGRGIDLGEEFNRESAIDLIIDGCPRVLADANSIEEESEGVDLFVLPSSVSLGLSSMFGLAIVLIVVLASSVMGTEYGWGTLRTALARGPGRWQFLGSKFAMIALAGACGLMVAAIFIGISSLIATQLASDGTELKSSGEWTDATILIGKAAFALVPYVLLAMALTILTSSATVGMAITMGYHIAEVIAVSVISVFVDGFDNIAGFILGVCVRALISEESGADFVFLVAGLSQGELPGTLQAFLVLLGYILLFGGAALWLFQRRDITGAKGT